VAGGKFQLGPDAPQAFVELHAGWHTVEFATRTMRWDTGAVRGELTVALGMPGSIRTPLMPEVPVTVSEVRSAPALVTELPTGVAVSWSPGPDVVITLGYSGTVDEALALARSLEPVDDATWAAAGVMDTSPADGCDSYFFC
jgi:hypothetical protein